MFNLFKHKAKSKTIVVTEREFWMRLERESVSRSVFDDQGHAHADIDLRLVEKIENYLVPILGPWENSPNWFHNIDFYGDGIRAISLTKAHFYKEFLPELQMLLVGEHQPFCILCQVHESLGGRESNKIGSLAIFSSKVMISNGLAELLVTQTE